MFDKMVRYVLAGAMAIAASGAQAFDCSDLWSFVGRSCGKAAAAWDHGDNEIILSGYAYHLRSTYSEEKLRELNEKAWGGGLARTVFDPDGDSHTIFLYGFHESHGKVQWNAGYLYTTYWGPQDGFHVGLGGTVFIVQRPDIASGVPIPAILPIASIGYAKANLMATFIPTVNGGVNNGSVFYVFGRYRF